MTYLRCIPLYFGPGGGTPSFFYAQFPRNVRLDKFLERKKSKFLENARSSKRGITIPDDNLK